MMMMSSSGIVLAYLYFFPGTGFKPDSGGAVAAVSADGGVGRVGAGKATFGSGAAVAAAVWLGRPGPAVRFRDVGVERWLAFARSCGPIDPAGAIAAVFSTERLASSIDGSFP